MGVHGKLGWLCVGCYTGKLKWQLLLNGRGGRLAAPNYEGWSCPYGQSWFGAVTEVCGRILDNRRRRRVESQMKRSLAEKWGVVLLVARELG
jgi:hypothetical protein